MSQLVEYAVVNDNLYIVSDANEGALVELMPWLLAENRTNELVSVVVVHDLLKILKNIYLSQEAVRNSNHELFDSNLQYHENMNSIDLLYSIQVRLPLPITFDVKSFYFKNGRLRYCPPLISPSHNVVEIEEDNFKSKSKYAKVFKFDNLIFLNRLIL